MLLASPAHCILVRSSAVECTRPCAFAAGLLANVRRQEQAESLSRQPYSFRGYYLSWRLATVPVFGLVLRGFPGA